VSLSSKLNIFGMKNINYKICRNRKAFTLAEVVAALTIGSMVLVAVLGIYTRAEQTADSITYKLESNLLPKEVLQRIAEDLDDIVGANSDTKITISRNKLDQLFQSARIEIVKTINDSKNNPVTFEKIIWQSSYDYDSWVDGLVLYRSHTGIAVEDKIFDEVRADVEKEYSFVPICEGVTFFKIQVPVGDKLQNRWVSDKLPHGIVVTISFAEPFKTVEGFFDVPEEEKITRTIAIDRSRKIKFKVVQKDYEDFFEGLEEDEQTEEDEQDPND